MDQLRRHFLRSGTGPSIVSFGGDIDRLPDTEKITLFVSGLVQHKRRTSDLTVVMNHYPTLFRDVCEAVLPNVLIAPLFQYIPPPN